MNDSYRYLEYAQDIVYNGISLQPHNRWYLGFVLFLSVFVKLGIPFIGIVVTQSIISLGSITMLSYRVAKVYGKEVGYMLAFLLISWFKVSEWNYYILTESLYTSGVMLFLSMMIPFNKKQLLYYVFGGLCFFFLRPTSILLLGAVVGTCLWVLKDRRSNVEVFFVVLVGLVGSYFVLNKMLESFIIVEAMERREAIFAYSTNPNFPMWDWVVFDVDKTLDYPKESYSQVTKMVLFVIYNPVFFVKLSLAKMFYFFGNVKPYLSWKHNIVIIVFLWSAYVFLFKGFKFLIREHKLFIISYLLLNALMIIMCSADWDGRFLIPVLPVVFIGTSVGLAQMGSLKRLFSKFC